MKLLSVKISRHDSNISYFDGKNLHYHKSERTEQVKHHHYLNILDWQNEMLDLWGVNSNDIDEIALILDPEDYNFPIIDRRIFPAIRSEEHTSELQSH